MVAEIGHSKRHVYTVVLLGDTIDHDKELVVDDLGVELKGSAYHRTARRGIELEHTPPGGVEFLARQTVFAGIEVHAHVGNLVGEARSRSGNKIDIGPEYQNGTRGFGELLGVGRNAYGIGTGEGTPVFHVEGGRLVARLEVGNESAVLDRYIGGIFRLTVLVGHLQIHRLLVQEVIGHHGILFVRGYLGIRLGAHTAEGPLPRSGIPRRVVVILHTHQRGHHGQTRLAVPEGGRRQNMSYRSHTGHLDKGGAGLGIAAVGIAHRQGHVIHAVAGIVYPGILLGRGLRRATGERPLPGRGVAGRHVGKGNLLAGSHLYLVNGFYTRYLQPVDGEVAHIAAHVHIVVRACGVGEAYLHLLAGILLERYGKLVPAPGFLAVLVATVPQQFRGGKGIGRYRDMQAAIVIHILAEAHITLQHGVGRHIELRTGSRGNASFKYLIRALDKERLRVVGVDGREGLVAGRAFQLPRERLGIGQSPALCSVVEIFLPHRHGATCTLATEVGRHTGRGRTEQLFLHRLFPGKRNVRCLFGRGYPIVHPFVGPLLRSHRANGPERSSQDQVYNNAFHTLTRLKNYWMNLIRCKISHPLSSRPYGIICR